MGDANRRNNRANNPNIPPGFLRHEKNRTEIFGTVFFMSIYHFNNQETKYETMS